MAAAEAEEIRPAGEGDGDEDEDEDDDGEELPALVKRVDLVYCGGAYRIRMECVCPCLTDSIDQSRRTRARPSSF